MPGTNRQRLQNQVALQRQRFLDAKQAAVFLGGLNFRTVLRWAREGYLPAYPVGEGKRRLWRFLETDLENWMLSRRTGTLSPATDAPIGGFVR
jgi:excisionase family DNA binding protein